MVDLSTENEVLENKIGPFGGKRLEKSKASLLEQFNNEKRAILNEARTKTLLNKTQ